MTYFVSFQREPGKSKKTDVALSLDDQKYTTEIELEDLASGPGVRILYSCPAGKGEVIARVKQLGDKEYSGNFRKI